MVPLDSDSDSYSYSSNLERGRILFQQLFQCNATAKIVSYPCGDHDVYPSNSFFIAFQFYNSAGTTNSITFEHQLRENCYLVKFSQ